MYIYLRAEHLLDGVLSVLFCLDFSKSSSLGKDNSISCPVKLFLCFRPSVDKGTDELKLLDLALNPSLAPRPLTSPPPLLFGTGNEAINYRMARRVRRTF